MAGAMYVSTLQYGPYAIYSGGCIGANRINRSIRWALEASKGVKAIARHRHGYWLEKPCRARIRCVMGMDQTANERTWLPCVVCGVLFDVKRKGAGALIRRRYTGDGRWLADGSCAGKTVEKKCEGIRPVVWRVFKQALQQQQKNGGKDCLQRQTVSLGLWRGEVEGLAG
jgi:hypothetical protein